MNESHERKNPGQQKIITLSNLEFKLIWLYALQVKYKHDNFDRELER